jgi:phosphoribosylaminoimidazole-succinocarboxamide synthase
MTDEKLASITDLYIELFENITGQKFEKDDYSHKLANIKSSIEKALSI